MGVKGVHPLKIAVALCACLSSPLMAGENDISPRQLEYLTSHLASVRVAVENAPFYAKPDPSAQPIRSFAWVQSLRVDTDRMKGAPPGWIPIRLPGHRKRRTEDVPDGWVRRRDVVFPGDYKEVIGCWPVRSVVFVAGDYSAEVTFEPDGTAKVKEWGDDEEVNKSLPRKAHVYLARSIVGIADLKGGAGFFTSGYRSGERRLYPEGGRAEEEQLFPESMLADCKSVPLLATEFVPISAR